MKFTVKERKGFPPKQLVRFEYYSPEAERVAVVGTFNNWLPEMGVMQAGEDGHWYGELELEPGVYEYCVVVDGIHYPDPKAPRNIPNPFGGQNSVLKVGK